MPGAIFADDKSAADHPLDALRNLAGSTRSITERQAAEVSGSSYADDYTATTLVVSVSARAEFSFRPGWPAAISAPVLGFTRT